MRKWRVLVPMHDYLVPPKDVSKFDVREVEWKMEFDVLETLEFMGHEVEPLGLASDLSPVPDAIARFRPDVIFNLMEEFQDVATYDHCWVSYLELLGVPYTGCQARGLLLARDKALAKKVLSYEGIAVPGFWVVQRHREPPVSRNLKFPLIVKSLIYDGSIGISQASVVTSDAKMRERVRYIHDVVGSDAIVEEFIEGRELYVGVVGNDRLRTFPVWELHFRRRPAGTRVIATDRVKWSGAYQKKMGVRTARALLNDTQKRSIQRVARRVFRALGLTGYARIDFRLASDGRLFVLEANPNPQLAYGEDFAESAEADGMSYESLLQRILSLGMSRRRS